MRTTPSWCALSILLATGAIAAFFSSTQEASAQSGSVLLYSYEKLVLGDDVQWVIVPRSGRMKLARGAKPSPAVLNGVFNELRGNKRATYGSTSLTVDARSLAKGTATVKVDSSKAQYFPIIAAETVYSLSQYGITSVSFPGQSRKPMTRADIQIGVFTLDIPAFKALPPRNVGPARITLPSGKVVSSKDFYAMMSAGKDDAQNLLKALLKSPDADTVQAALAATQHLAPKGWQGLVTPLFKHKEPSVRVAALRALSSAKDDATLDQIAAVMNNDKDSKVAEAAASILGKSTNTRYAAMATFVQLRSKDENVVLEAIQTLTKLAEPSSAPELYKVATGTSEKSAQAAITALASLKQAKLLTQLFNDAKQPLSRRILAANTARSLGDANASFAALTFLASQAPRDKALPALDALAATKSPDPRPSIEAALQHPEQPIRFHAAELLTKIKNSASLKPLAAAAKKTEDAEAMQDAAAVIMGPLPLQDILSYTRSRDAILKRIAYQALGQKVGGAGNKAIFDTLASGVKSNDTGIQAASAKGLGPYKNEKALKLILSVASSKDAKVRRAAAQALGNWSKTDGKEALMKYLKDSDGPVVEAAVRSLTKRTATDAYKPIVQLYTPNRHPYPGVRAATLKAITVLADKNPRAQQTVISILSGGVGDPDQNVRYQAIDLLGTFNNAAAVMGLSSRLNDPDTQLRLAAIQALGKTGSKDAVDLVASVLSDPNRDIRLAAVEALAAIGHKDGSAPLRKQLSKESDAEVKIEIAKALKKTK